MAQQQYHELAPDLTPEQIRAIGLRARLEAAQARAALQRVIGESREALKRAAQVLDKR
jgi:hypothetical protein